MLECGREGKKLGGPGHLPSGVSWNSSTCPSSALVSTSVMPLGHVSDVSGSLIQMELVHCGKLGSGTEKLLALCLILGCKV